MFKTASKPETTCTHPSTILLSVHKGASTFLASDFAPAVVKAFPGMRHVVMGQEMVDGGSVEEFPISPTGMIISRVYPFLYNTIVEEPVPDGGRFADKKLIMLRRDPRDVAVSFYYSIRYSHTPKTRNPDGFMSKREALSQMDVADGIAEHTAKTAINQFLATTRFLKRYPQTLLAPYEQLTLDFEGWFSAVADHLNWSAEERAAVGGGLDKTVAAPKTEDPMKHKRRVTPGNWREVFDDRLRSVFQDQIGEELSAAGYEW